MATAPDAAGSSEGSTLLNVSEDLKRWMVFGIALSRVLVPQSLAFLKQEVEKDYSNLKTRHSIHVQSSSSYLKQWSHRGQSLKYENINKNDAFPRLAGGRYDYAKFDYRVSSHVDFAKLYLESHMIKFNAFDESCDASAVLLLLARIPVFSSAVQKAADAVRKARNNWAHCVFRDWDDASFQMRFEQMERLAKSYHLPDVDEDKLVNDLCDWKKRGVTLCMNASVDSDLLKLVLHHLNALRNEVDNMAFAKKEEGENKAKIKNALEDVLKRIQEMENAIKDVQYEQEKVSRRVDRIEHNLAASQNQIDKLQARQDDVQRQNRGAYQKFSRCESDINFFHDRYDPDTRQWLLKDFDAWFSCPGESKAYVLLGDAAVGKSVMAAVIAKRARENGRLAAAYFCRHFDGTRRDPRYLLGSIAYQLCKCNDDYNERVRGETGIESMLASSELGVQELCTKLLEEPLWGCNVEQQRKLVVIDALDETEYDSRDDFLDLIMIRFPQLPKWIVFFITSRPEDTVQFRLNTYSPCIRICVGNNNPSKFYQSHEQDICLYLQKRIGSSCLPYSVDDIAKKCNGVFLYAFYSAKMLQNLLDSGKTLPELDDLVPEDIGRYFCENFTRISQVFGKDHLGLHQKLFGCALVAPHSLPLSFVSFILQRENLCLDKQKVVDAISHFLRSDRTFTFLHSLIPAWLTDEKKSRRFFVDKNQAKKYFTCCVVDLLSNILNDIQVKQDLHDYVLCVGARFLCEHDQNTSYVETVFKCLTSYKFLHSRLQTSRTELYSIIDDLKLCIGIKDLSTKNIRILQDLLLVLESQIQVLSLCPHLLHCCLRSASKLIQKNITIPLDLFATEIDTTWVPYLASCAFPRNMTCFALSPDRISLACGHGKCISLFDACSLQRVADPIEIECLSSVDCLEFSPDSKFLFFGRLDMWLSVLRRRVEKFGQFSSNNLLYERGCFVSDGHYILVEAGRRRQEKHDLDGLLYTLLKWFKHEGEQISKRCFTICFERIVRRYAALLSLINGEFMSDLESSPRLSYCSLNQEAILNSLVPPFSESLHSSQKKADVIWTNILDWFFTHLSSAINYQHESKYHHHHHPDCFVGNQTSAQSPRDCVVKLYPYIFHYQIWNMDTGGSALEEIMRESSSSQPFLEISSRLPRYFYLCHMITDIASLENDSEVLPPLFFTAMVNTVSLYNRKVKRYIVNAPQPPLFSRSFAWTDVPTQFQNFTRKKVLLSQDGKWLAKFDTTSGQSVELFNNSFGIRRLVDRNDPVFIVNDVQQFAFTDDSHYFLYFFSDNSLHCLVLDSRNHLSSVSGLTPLYITSGEAGFHFRGADEEKTLSIAEFPRTLFRFLSVKYMSVKQANVAYFSSDCIVSVSSGASRCKVWGKNDCRERLTLRSVISLRHPSSSRNVNVTKCTFSKHEKLTATQQNCEVLLFKELKFLCSVFKSEEDECSVPFLKFSPDGSLLLFCIQRESDCQSFYVYDIQSQLISAPFVLRNIPLVECCCISPDNAKLIFIGKAFIEIWEKQMYSWQFLRTLDSFPHYSQSDKFSDCAVSPNNTLLACYVANIIYISQLDTSTGQKFLAVPHGHLVNINYCHFLKGSRYLISCGVDGTVFLFDLSKWQAISYAKIANGGECILCMAVSPSEDEAVGITSSDQLQIIRFLGLQDEIPFRLPWPLAKRMSPVEKKTPGLQSPGSSADETAMIEEMNYMLPSDTSDDDGDDELCDMDVDSDVEYVEGVEAM